MSEAVALKLNATSLVGCFHSTKVSEHALWFDTFLGTLQDSVVYHRVAHLSFSLCDHTDMLWSVCHSIVGTLCCCLWTFCFSDTSYRNLCAHLFGLLVLIMCKPPRHLWSMDWEGWVAKDLFLCLPKSELRKNIWHKPIVSGTGFSLVCQGYQR